MSEILPGCANFTFTNSNGFVFLCTSLYLVNSSDYFEFETNEPASGYVRSRGCDPVECLAKVLQSKIYTRFSANSIGILVLFKVECKAEGLTQGQHLVIMMMDTDLEENSQASSILRVYYDPPTSSPSKVRLFFKKIHALIYLVYLVIPRLSPLIHFSQSDWFALFGSFCVLLIGTMWDGPAHWWSLDLSGCSQGDALAPPKKGMEEMADRGLLRWWNLQDSSKVHLSRLRLMNIPSYPVINMHTFT